MAPEVPQAGSGIPAATAATGHRVVVGGGIGAGKSAVCEVLEHRGFLVVSADEVGHQVLAGDPGTISKVAELWPDAVTDGVVDRSVLASEVFADARQLESLEEIMHPRIVEAIERLVEANPSDDVAVEVPLLPLVSNTPYLMSDGFLRIAVVADDRTRLARAVARGGDATDIARRMRVQASDDAWRRWADVTIDNSGPWSATEAVVQALVEGLADG